MQNDILYPVKKDDVVIQDKRMHKYLYKANTVDINSTYKALTEAKEALDIAKGFYNALKGLGLLPEGNRTGEDIERIDQKISDILADKRRKDLPKWKH